MKRTLLINLLETVIKEGRYDFVTDVIVDGIVLGTGSGNTKKSSEQMAAKEALLLMGVKI